jgi:hypothetical protein
MSRRLIAVGLAVTALALAGCSSGASVHVGNSVSASTTATSTTPNGSYMKLVDGILNLTRRRGLAADSVDCAGAVPNKTGETLACTAHYKRGGTGRFIVTARDDAGNVHIQAAEMIAPEIEDDIAKRAKSFVTVKCPEHVPVVIGNTFHCISTNGTRNHNILVRIIDRDAGFRWRVLT